MFEYASARVVLVVALTLLSGTASTQSAGEVEAQPSRAEVRQLIEELLDADPPSRRRILRKTQWSDRKVVEQLLGSAKQAQKDTEHTVRVIRLVGELGIGADTAWPLLVAFMEDPERKKLEIGKAMRKPKTRVGPTAAIALGALAPYVANDRESVTEALQTELRHHHGFHIADVRRAYFRALVAARGEPSELVKQLGDDNPYVRETAAEALGSRGRDARDAVPSLVEAFHGSHPRKVSVNFGGWSGSSSASWDKKIHAAAARALVRIAPADKRTFEAHLHVARHEKDPDLLVTSLRHVGFMSKEGEPALDRLCKLVEHENTLVAAEAVTAIGMIGIKNDEVLAALRRGAEREEKAVAARATATIRMLDRDD